MATPSFPSAQQEPPGWRSVLGIPETGSDSHAAIRLVQRAEIARLTPPWLLVNLFAAVMLTITLQGAVPLAHIATWLGGVVIVCALILVSGGRSSGRDPTKGLVSDTVAGAISLGLLWMIPQSAFSGVGLSQGNAALAAICPGMMAAGVLMLTATPLAAMAFVVIVGLGNCVMMARHGSVPLTALGCFYTGSMVMGSLSKGRAVVRRVHAELALAEQTEVVSLLLGEFEGSRADWLWQVDASKCLVNVSPRLAAKLGADATDMEGKPLLKLVAAQAWEDGNFADGHRMLAERLNARESFGDLLLPVQIRGETRCWKLSASPRWDERGRFVGFWGVGSDVTEQRRSVEKMDQMARFDSLTGLANRAQVMEALADSLTLGHRDGRRSAFMIVDLDRFKAVNDTLGHPIGDRLLRKVADRLRGLCQANDLCGRLGGDEFALVIGDASDRPRIERLAETIIGRLSTPFEIDEHRLFIGASVGIATSPIDGRSVEMLVRNADLALYRAKEDGRGTFRRYEEQFHARAEERREIEGALREALELGQFRLVYQPIVAAADGKVEAFEAFLRWTHPTLGDISPDRFVPIAEEARLIGRIGEWVIRTACAEAMTWPNQVGLSINLSAEQLHDPELMVTLMSALSHSGLAAHRLELEITEAVFLREGAATAVIVDKLMALGVGVALADFGTGHSSLGYLRAARFSTIKIDRSFVRGAVDNAAASIGIIRAVVAVADSLGIKTTAEGAETAQEYSMVRKLGCRQVQGYLFGRPVPPDQARLLVNQGQQRVA